MIGQDKKMHFITGMLLAFILLLFSFVFTFLTPLFIFEVVLGVGFAKEVIWDFMLKKGCFEVADFIATGLGGTLIIQIYKVLWGV
jgi:hypothetical protein